MQSKKLRENEFSLVFHNQHWFFFSRESLKIHKRRLRTMFWLKFFKISLRNINEIWKKWPKLNLILAPKFVKLKENDLCLIFHDKSWFFWLLLLIYCRETQKIHTLSSQIKKALFSQLFSKKKLWNLTFYQVN